MDDDIFETPDPNREVGGWTSFSTSSDGEHFERVGKWKPIYVDQIQENKSE